MGVELGISWRDLHEMDQIDVSIMVYYHGLFNKPE